MDSCQCSHSSYVDEPLPLMKDYLITSGDVYTINESVCTPIYDILRQSNLERAQFAQSQESFHSVLSRPNPTRHQEGRPCIMVEYCRDSPRRKTMRKVCLVTTYCGRHISTLPRIFKEFSIPIVPHYAITSDSEFHLHSLPQWNRDDAWIIGWVFRTNRPLIRRMRAKRETGGLGENVVFGRAAMAFLMKDTDRRRAEWLDKCTDPKFAGSYAKEFYAHRKALVAAEAASRYSLATQDSCRTVRNSIYKVPHQSRAGY